MLSGAINFHVKLEHFCFIKHLLASYCIPLVHLDSQRWLPHQPPGLLRWDSLWSAESSHVWHYQHWPVHSSRHEDQSHNATGWKAVLHKVCKILCWIKRCQGYQCFRDSWSYPTKHTGTTTDHNNIHVQWTGQDTKLLFWKCLSAKITTYSLGRTLT